MRIQVTKKNATVFYAIIQALYFCTLALIGSYASAYLLNRNFTNAQIGIMLGVGNLGSVGLQLLIAAYVQRLGIRLGHVMFVIYALIAVLALALLLLPLGSSAIFCILFVLVFLLNSSMQAPVNSLYRGYHEQGVKINFSAARGCGSVAYSLSSLAAGALIQRFTPNVLPGTYILPCLLLCVAVLLFNAPNTAEKQANSVTPKEKKLLMKDYPQFYIFFAGVICLATSHSFMDTYLFQIIENIGGNSVNLGLAVFISCMTELPAMLLYRRMADKFGNRRLLAFAGWMWALKNFLIAIAPNVYFIYAAELLQFVGYAIYVPAGVRYIAHTLPESEFLKGQALVGSAFTAGFLITGFVGGPMIDLIGLEATLWGLQLFSVGGVLLFTLAMTKSLHMFPSVHAAKEKK